MERFDAILPAGGRIDGAFAQRVGTASKALIDVGGQTILARTLQALTDSGKVARTVVIGGDEVLNHADATRATHRLAEGATGPDNIFRGVDALLASGEPPERVLIVTTDLPFLTPGLVQRYVAMCPAGADISVPLICKAEFESRFPGVPATFVALKDDVWTTGCMYLLNVKALQRARPHIDRVFENRKSKLGMARLLGAGFVLKWLTKRLTLRDVESNIQSMLGCTGAAVTGAPPELAFDIDCPEDYDYALAHLNGKP